MKTTIKFIVFVLSVALFGTACNNEPLISPAYFTAEQNGNAVYLGWTSVTNATMYEISKNGAGWQSTSFTSIVDNNPKEGYNRYELYAIINHKSYAVGIANVYFDSDTSTGGGENPEPPQPPVYTILPSRAAELTRNGDKGTYNIEGYVISMYQNYSAEYDNQSFWMADSPNGDGIFVAWRVKNDGLKENVPIGSKVRVDNAQLRQYNDICETEPGATFVVLEKGNGNGGNSGNETINLSEVSISNISSTSVTCKYKLSYSNAYLESVGIAYAPVSNTDDINILELNNDNLTELQSKSSGAYTITFNIGSLQAGTQYVVTAYAITNNDTYFGEGNIFTTSSR